MIIYTPLDIPKIEPNNWDEWWEVWNTYSAPLTKTRQNHNQIDHIGKTTWKGFDVYRVHDLLKNLHAYQAPLVPTSPVILDLIEQVKKHCILTPTLIRVIENVIPVDPHSDLSYPNKYEFRSVLWNTYKTPIWNFTYENEVRDMILPEDTNSFYYLDYPVKHASVYNPSYSKGLLLVYGTQKNDTTKIVNRSVEKYKEVVWVV
jgi:hypothetical protein